AAFTTLGASAKAAGIDAAEQFAVLGQLQATMSGSEAGTKYKAFLAAVGSAQKKLGLNFVNKDGTMKSVVEIMKLIRGKFGDLSKVADSDLLKSAFGSDEAVAMIKLLNADIG
ncbi:phage tail tape measure protein, partial [Escherichia coli]